MDRKNNCLLWEISNFKGESLGFLFGTMHINSPATNLKLQFPLDLLQDVDALFLEVDPRDVNYLELAVFYQLSNGQLLKDFFNAKKYSRLKRSLLRFSDVNLDAHQNISPFFLINDIHLKMLENLSGKPMDMVLFDKALEMDKEVNGLIPPDNELKIIKSIDVQEQAAQLYSFSRNISREKAKIQRLTYLYLQEKIHHLYRITRKQSGGLKKVILYDRNFLMLETIKDHLISGKKSFIAVGAAHLSGKYGLISLLKRQGWRLKPYDVKSI